MLVLWIFCSRMRVRENFILSIYFLLYSLNLTLLGAGKTLFASFSEISVKMQYLCVFVICTFASITNSRKVVILDDNEWDSIDVTSPPLKIHPQRFKNATKPRSLADCPEGDIKCLYDGNLHESSNNEDTVKKFLEKFSSVTNVKINEEHRNNSKAYWNQINTDKHNHPFDDKKGWVTLDPIPWSSSEISKWESNKKPNPPWTYNNPQQQFWVTSNNHNSHPSANWHLGSNDIVTDNSPSGFPTETQYRPQYQETRPTYSYQSTIQVRPPASQTSPSLNWQRPYNSYTTSRPIESVPTRYPNTPNHPSTYPSEGSGQWVLLSTTKGYSIPQRFYDRKLQVQENLNDIASTRPEIVSRSFKSRYAENNLTPIDRKFTLISKSDLNANRKNSEEVDNDMWNVDGVNILRTQDGKNFDDQTMSFKRKVRLTVLPALDNTSTTSHGGMLEVDANQQSVEEHKLAEDKLKNLQQIAAISSLHVPKTQQIHRFVKVGKSKNVFDNKKKAAVLAAVGAGMIPATMAVLLPVALGRKRRSLNSLDDKPMTLRDWRQKHDFLSR